MKSTGQGSIIGNKKSEEKSEVSFKRKVKYYFNSALSKTPYFVIFLIITAFILGLLMAIIQYYVDASTEVTFFDKWWDSVTKILGLGSGATWAKRLIAFMFWAFGIAISGTVIGFIATGIKGLVEKLKKGKSPIISKNHILIIGWSDSIFAILKELSIANENVKNTTVVIFSSLKNEKMEDEIAAKINSKLNLKIITRSGDSSNPIELEIVNPKEAKTILVLSQDNISDSQVIISILALASIIKNNTIPIIAQINDAIHIKNLESLKNINVVPVLSKNIITNVTAQTLRQKGIGAIILDLLDFDGDEIYFAEINELVNKSYSEALLALKNHLQLGIVDANGVSCLNPANETIIKKGEKLILISEDDSTIFYKPQAASQNNNFNLPTSKKSISEKHILFIGWSEMGVEILNTLSTFLSSSSDITVLYLPNFVEPSQLEKTNFNNINVQFKEINIHEFDLEKYISSGKFEEIMVLGYTHEISIPDADVLTLMEMLKLDSIKHTNTHIKFRVLAQIYDSRKAKLASATETEELIISDNLSAILIAQLTENPALNPIFNDIFDADGAAINIYPIENYAELGKETKYVDIVNIGIKYKESVIGIRIDNLEVNDHTEGVYLNPSKNKVFTPKKGDQVIVISMA
jgi:hypothetical protein